MALDGYGRASSKTDALDHIGIERALGKEVGASNRFCFGLENVDEFRADEFALRFRVGDTVQTAEEILTRVDMDERDIVTVAEQADDLIGFAQPH